MEGLKRYLVLHIFSLYKKYKVFFMLEKILIFSLLLLPTAFAEIQITLPDKDYYNLGQKIEPAVSVKESSAYYGFFKMYIICGSYALQYYATPLELEADFRTQITSPSLSLSDSMAGKCALRATIDKNNGERTASADSKPFIVDTKLKINIDSLLQSKPGQDAELTGDVRTSDNKLLEKGEAEINFGASKESVAVLSGKLGYKIHLEKSLKAGNATVGIKVFDKYGNYGEKIFGFGVLSIPTSIDNKIEKGILIPGDSFRVKVTLYDHSNILMKGRKINVKVFGPDEKPIAENDIENEAYFELKTENTQKPGAYYIISSFENVNEKSSFIVETVKKIDMKQENGFVKIKNTGNVDYDEQVTIILERNDKKYAINKKIKLKTEEETTIDLSKEVPQGDYDIILPAESAESKNFSSNESEKSSNSTENVFRNIHIDDNRDLIKKTSDGVSSITGALIGAAGYVASRPALATGILVLIVLATILHYSWGFIRNRIIGRKRDTEHIFNDYKFEEYNKKR